MDTNHSHPIITAVFLVLGLVFKGVDIAVKDLPVFTGIIVDFITGVSLIIVVIINLPKALKVLRGKKD